MATQLGSTERVQTRVRIDVAPAARRLLADGIVAGLAGAVALAIPLVIWDWAHAAHKALEVFMAFTAWPFGLQHFSNTSNQWWPIVLGAVLLGVYGALSGLAFAALADRVFALDSPESSLIGGAVWGFVSFMFFWYMLLPIARDGAPFRATATDPTAFVATNWVWILGFTLFGLVTGAVYGALRASRTMEAESRSTTETEFDRKLRYAS